MAGRGSQPGEYRGGRKRGTPNKTTTALKEAILAAAHAAGGKGGMVGYLKTLATENSGAFASLLGKVLPLQIAGDPDNPIRHVISAEPLSEEEWASMHGTKD